MRAALLLVTLLCVSVMPATAQRSGAAATTAVSPLQGVWQVVGAAGGPQVNGLFIFTRTHYSMMMAAADRPDLVDMNAASADQLRAVFDPVAANSGTYDVAGDLVTIHPVAAKFPVVMKPGATEVYAFRIEGNALSFTQRRNARGVEVQNAMPRRLVRVE